MLPSGGEHEFTSKLIKIESAGEENLIGSLNHIKFYLHWDSKHNSFYGRYNDISKTFIDEKSNITS